MGRRALVIALALASGGIARAQRTGIGAAQGETERCRRLFEDREYAKAEQACASALRKDASYVDAWTIYLSTLIAQQKEGKAIEEATRAEDTLGIRDASVFALHGAAILQVAGRPPVDPKTQQANKWAKQQARALPYLERAVAQSGKEIRAQALLCTYWKFEREYLDRSAAACQTGLRMQPNNTDLLVSLAWIHYNRKRYADAQTTAEQVLRLAQDDKGPAVKAKVVIGLSQAERGDCDNARRTLEPLKKLIAERDTGALIERGLSLCATRGDQ